MDKDIDILDVRPGYQIQIKTGVSLRHFAPWYSISQTPRGGRESGTAVVYKKSLNTKAVKETHKFSSFEVMKVFFNQHGVSARCAIIYSHLPSRTNKSNFRTFV